MTTSPAKRRLAEALKDREYREAFVAAYADETIPFQIRAMRDQESRRWSQKDLAEKAGMKQTRISLLENPNHKNCSIRILKQLAAAFDVALVVRFVPFSELAEWTLNLSPESLEVPGFEEERYFREHDDSVPHAGLVALQSITEVSSDAIALQDYLDRKDATLSVSIAPLSEANAMFLVQR